MTNTKYPAGWDEERVKRVLAHYEQQTDDEAVAEDEAAYESTTHTGKKVITYSGTAVNASSLTARPQASVSYSALVRSGRPVCNSWRGQRMA